MSKSAIIHSIKANIDEDTKQTLLQFLSISGTRCSETASLAMVKIIFSIFFYKPIQKNFGAKNFPKKLIKIFKNFEIKKKKKKIQKF